MEAIPISTKSLSFLLVAMRKGFLFYIFGVSKEFTQHQKKMLKSQTTRLPLSRSLFAYFSIFFPLISPNRLCFRISSCHFRIFHTRNSAKPVAVFPRPISCAAYFGSTRWYNVHRGFWDDPSRSPDEAIPDTNSPRSPLIAFLEFPAHYLYDLMPLEYKCMCLVMQQRWVNRGNHSDTPRH